MKLGHLLKGLTLIVLAGFVCLAWFAQASWAQTGTGTITGTVRDPNQSVVPAAEITVTNTQTNVVTKAKTNEAGVYYLGALQIGPYRMTVEVQGFKTWEGTLQLPTGQTVVVDPTLQVGDVRTVVEVKGAAPVITTQSVEVSNVKDFERIRQLPLNGRSIGNLFTLTPGVEGPAGGARVNGMKVGSLEITYDGLSIVDRFGGGISRVQPPLDTVQEFRIETVGSDARYSRPSNVTIATRSGTNTFHGSLFETHRDNSAGFRVRRREEKPDPVTGKFSPAQLIRNEYGGSAGGPFYIPGVYDGRDKSFWFAAFEGSRLLQRRLNTDDENAQRVPTQAMWDGDLTNAMDVEGNPITIYDPLTTDANGVRQPISCNGVVNVICPDRISQTAKALAAITARPNIDENPYLGPNFVKFYPDRTKLWNLTIKGDHHFSDKDSLSVRWTRSKTNAAVEGGVFGDPVDASAGVGTSRSDAIVHNVAVNYNRTLSATLLNELLVGVHRSFKSSGTLADFTDWAGNLGLPNPFGTTGWPTFCAYNLGYYYGFCWDGDNRKDEALTAEVLDDNVTWIKSKHTIKFGGRIRLEQNNVRELQQAQGSHTFGGNWTALVDPEDPSNPLPYTGDGFAELLLGLPTTLRNQYNRGYFYFRQKEIGLYVNDNWKVSPRLTLTLGLRWDKWTPYTEKFNRLTTLDLNSLADPNSFQVITPGDVRMEDLPGIPPSVLSSWATRGLTWTTANSVGYPSNLFRADNNNFGPRLGAAFRITNHTVLRGGYGEYFWTVPLAQLLQASRTNPPLNLLYRNAMNERNFPLNTFTLVGQATPNDFLPTATVDISGAGVISPTAQGEFIWDGRNWTDGRAQEWHVTLERELPHETALRLSYIGTHGTDLEQVFSVNTRESEYNYAVRTGLNPRDPGNPETGGNLDFLRVNHNWAPSAKNRTGYSNTHSGQIEIERRFSQGLAFQWFYTFTRSLNTTDTPGFSNGGAGINDGGTSSGGGGSVPQITQILGEPNLTYDQRLRLAYFNSTALPPHRVRFNGIVDLPFGRGKRFGRDVSGPLNQIIGGWQIATIGDWRSGLWQSISTSRFQAGFPNLPAFMRPEMTYQGDHQRLWFRGDVNLSTATNFTGGASPNIVPLDPAHRVVRPFGPNCDGNFVGSSPRLAVTLGDGSCYNAPTNDFYNPSPRASIIGPGAWNTDLSIFKNFKVKERVNIRFTADFFNAFNHPIDDVPNSTTGLQNLSRQTNEPRIIQFSLRLDW
ncbi:MAG: TonB-dependent receptor [Terriglobia bacterium]